MSDLQPKGIKISLPGVVECEVRFTISVVDEVQDHFDKSVGEVMSDLTDRRASYDTLAFLVMALVNNAIRRSKSGGELLTLEEVKDLIDIPMANELVRPVMRAYGYSLPEDDDEGDDPNPKSSRSN